MQKGLIVHYSLFLFLSKNEINCIANNDRPDSVFVYTKESGIRLTDLPFAFISVTKPLTIFLVLSVIFCFRSLTN